ncbi:hypothetical protein [Enterobacter ludwigii]|uniref:hypothetical protein n=1 Tax=Enterobacter ludwigii TaxID=299767 RepID=UPI0018686499|nr:hypothetical protein [Enterobacter ludwigii]
MKKNAIYLLAATLLLLLSGCAAVSFTHANGTGGQSVTNAEVQPDNTVVLTYPNGSACIDTNPGASQNCKSGGP